MRDATEIDIDLPWDVVHAVSRNTVPITQKRPKVTVDKIAFYVDDPKDYMTHMLDYA